MKIKDLSKEDIELMSYEELAKLIISEKKSKMKIVDIFKKICELKEMSTAEFENKIADFYDLISTSKEFIVLEKGFCDLRKKHTPDVIMDEEEDIPEVEESDLPEEETENEEEDYYYDSSSDEDDVDDDTDELADFMVVDEDEEASI